MFLTKNHLSRRALIRGAGVTLALPFLDSMVPAQTHAGQDRRQSEDPLCRRVLGAWMVPDLLERWPPGRAAHGRAQCRTRIHPHSSGALQGPAHHRWWTRRDLPPHAASPDRAAATTPARRRRLRPARLPRRPPAPISAAARASIRTSPSGSVRTPCCPRCRSPSKIPAPAPASADGVTAALTPTPFRGKARPSRCRTRSTPQVIFERLFGDGATPEEERAARKRTNGSILDATIHEGRPSATAPCPAATKPGSATTLKTSAKWSAACSSRQSVRTMLRTCPPGRPANRRRTH